MREDEPGGRVPGLHPEDSVDPEVPVTGYLEGQALDGKAQPSPPPPGPNDIEAAEREVVAVPLHREGADHLVPRFDREEPAGIGRPEGVRVVETRVPALVRSEIDSEPKLGADHGADTGRRIGAERDRQIHENSST